MDDHNNPDQIRAEQVEDELALLIVYVSQLVSVETLGELLDLEPGEAEERIAAGQGRVLGMSSERLAAITAAIGEPDE